MIYDTQEKLVSNNYYLNKSAKEAYRGYLLAYNSHPSKDIFNIHRLDLQVSSYFPICFIRGKVGTRKILSQKTRISNLLQAVATSFCFSSPPNINLNIESNASKFRKKKRKVEGRRNGFSESNPYGRKGGDDTRQFVRY